MSLGYPNDMSVSQNPTTNSETTNPELSRILDQLEQSNFFYLLLFLSEQSGWLNHSGKFRGFGFWYWLLDPVNKICMYKKSSCSPHYGFANF